MYLNYQNIELEPNKTNNGSQKNINVIMSDTEEKKCVLSFLRCTFLFNAWAFLKLRKFTHNSHNVSIYWIEVLTEDM